MSWGKGPWWGKRRGGEADPSSTKKKNRTSSSSKERRVNASSANPYRKKGQSTLQRKNVVTGASSAGGRKESLIETSRKRPLLYTWGERGKGTEHLLRDLEKEKRKKSGTALTGKGTTTPNDEKGLKKTKTFISPDARRQKGGGNQIGRRGKKRDLLTHVGKGHRLNLYKKAVSEGAGRF